MGKSSDRVGGVVEILSVRRSGPRTWGKIVVAVCHPMHADRRGEPVAFHLAATAERIARREILKVARAQLVGLSRRVERIAEAHEARDLTGGMQIGRAHARNPSAHRLSADDKLLTLGS
jgi:hypothetical protein